MLCGNGRVDSEMPGSTQEQPILNARGAEDDLAATYSYDSIDDVHDHVFRELVLQLLRQDGQTIRESEAQAMR